MNSKGKSLLLKNPKIAKEWHPTMNGDLKPEDFTPGSEKIVWWQCTDSKDHVWKERIYQRTRKKNARCKYCNTLLSKFPDLAKQWHPIKNGNLTPDQVAPGSGKKVWWKCEKGEDHEWKAMVQHVVKSKANGCPYCDGKKVSKSNSLLSRNPDLAKQWHPTKNGILTPDLFTAGSDKKVWWKCEKGEDHEWKATINGRSHGKGCPKCNPMSSKPEIRLLTELKGIFGSENVNWRKRIKNIEVDIFIPMINTGIEYDGFYWHKK